MSEPIRVGLLGFGAIGREVARLLRGVAGVSIVGVAKSTPLRSEDALILPAGARCMHRPEDFAALEIDLAVECAGGPALATFAPATLRRGHDLLIASVGALADADLESTLRTEAEGSGARILIAAGALGGLDVLSAARLLGLDDVTYIGRKPPRAWHGTRAQQVIDLDALGAHAALVFDGNAREAALQFPQNANVTAAVAIAGLGFERTRVQLLADGSLEGNEHHVHARGPLCSFEINVRASALPENPRSSRLAPCSLVRAITNRNATIAFA